MNIRTVTFCVLLSLFVGVPLFVSAQTSDTFEVSQVVTGFTDVTPPTVPTGLSATAVSTSQIDLVWTASTDDVAVTGYQVFRDGIFIATSTTPNYSDSGLNPNTTYEYTVTAFDAVFNISGLSAPASATTLEEGGGGGGTPRIIIVETDVAPAETSTVISWRTNLPARSKVSWGTTDEYELGTLAEVDAKKEHDAKLDGLVPGTRYYFEIVALNRFGNVSDSFRGTFVTTSSPDTTPPASPTRFEANPGDGVIELSWTNPTDIDLEAIRIIRSDKFFPDTPFAGKLIFDGLGTNVTDSDVLPGITYYYAAFARDTSGNYASPAVATASLGEEIVEEPFEEFPEAPEEEVPEGVELLRLLDFDFIQNGKNISYLGTEIPVDGNEELTVSIDYDKLPEVLKTIGITLHDPVETSKTFSFLLRINEDKTRYTATLAPLGRSGVYDLIATVLDLKNQKLKTFEGELVVPEQEVIEEKTSFWKTIFWWSISLILLLIILFIIFWLLRRRRDEEEEEIEETHVHI